MEAIVKTLLRGAAAVTATTALLAVTGVAAMAAAVTVPAVTTVSPAKISAAGGATVTLTGSKFTGATGVTFDGVAATSFTVASSTRITAVAPAGTNGAAAIAVTTPGGTNAESSRSRITYRTVLGVDTADSPTVKAGGGPVVLTVTGGTLGATAKEFGSEFVAVLLNGKTRLFATWVDETRIRVVVPATAADAAELTVVHDTIAGAPATITLAPVVTNLTVKASPVGGGGTTVVKVAGADIANATGFRFGDVAATCTKVGTSTNIQFSCVVPPAAAAGPVVVSFTSGSGKPSRFTAAAAFAYTQN
jgi:hypothetical protein